MTHYIICRHLNIIITFRIINSCNIRIFAFFFDKFRIYFVIMVRIRNYNIQQFLIKISFFNSNIHYCSCFAIIIFRIAFNSTRKINFNYRCCFIYWEFLCFSIFCFIPSHVWCSKMCNNVIIVRAKNDFSRHLNHKISVCFSNNPSIFKFVPFFISFIG